MKCVKDHFGTKRWYLNNKLHRIDGPAIINFYWEYWYLNDKILGEFDYYAILKIRKFRSKIVRFNNALEFKLETALHLSRSRAMVEWYYSPDNGGGKLAKRRIEHVISV